MDENNIKMDLKHKAYVGADWIQLVHDRFMNKVM
jgi:hypothetical protein